MLCVASRTSTLNWLTFSSESWVVASEHRTHSLTHTGERERVSERGVATQQSIAQSSHIQLNFKFFFVFASQSGEVSSEMGEKKSGELIRKNVGSASARAKASLCLLDHRLRNRQHTTHTSQKSCESLWFRSHFIYRAWALCAFFSAAWRWWCSWRPSSSSVGRWWWDGEIWEI